MWKDNSVVYCLEVLDKPPPWALGSVPGTSTRDNEVLRFVMHFGLYASKGFFT